MFKGKHFFCSLPFIVRFYRIAQEQVHVIQFTAKTSFVYDI